MDDLMMLLLCRFLRTAQAAAMDAVAEALPLSYGKKGKITANKSSPDDKSQKDAS